MCIRDRYRDCLKKAKLDLNEFLTECRNNGYFNLSEIQTAIMETNGKISILPAAASRPVTPADINLTPAQEKLPVNLIIDGVVLYENLQAIGKDEKDVYKRQNIGFIPDSSLFSRQVAISVLINPSCNHLIRCIITRITAWCPS